MNKKIRILLLCALFLVGVPSLNVFANDDNTTSIKTLARENHVPFKAEDKSIIMPLAQADWGMTTDGYYISWDDSEEAYTYDMVNVFAMDYNGTRVVQEPITYTLMKLDGTELTKQPYVFGDTLNVEDLPIDGDGDYAIVFQFKSGITTISGGVYFSVIRIGVRTEIDRGVNPKSIVNETLAKKEALYDDPKDAIVEPNIIPTWTMSNDKGDTYSGTGDISEAFLKALPEGSYTYEVTSEKTSKYGNKVDDVTNGSFVIRYPQPTTSVDREINPGSLTGTQKLPTNESDLSWEIYDSKNVKVASGTGTAVDAATIEDLKEGSYTIKHVETDKITGETASSDGVFTIRYPQPTTEVNREVNPTEIEGSPKLPAGQSNLTWEIINEDNEVVASGSGTLIGESILKDLAEGKYTIQHTETDVVTGETAESEDNFVIRHPQPTTSVDKEVNPTEITGSQKLAEDESDVTWEIFDKDGKSVATGTGTTIGEDVLEELGEGKFKVVHTETDKVTKEVAESEENFVIRYPQPTTSIDREVNPKAISGSQKLADTESDLVWAILDENNNPVVNGTGANIDASIIKDLEEGKYKVVHTETDKITGEVAESEKSFVIRYPQPTTTVDKEVNPKEITGTQKLPETESDLTWEIFDKDGKSVATGTGTTIDESVLKELPNGSYTVKHTETDKVTKEEAESNGEFIIRYPQPTTSVDRGVNPKEITGSQKLPEDQSDLVWEIFDNDGKSVATGTGTTISEDVLKDLVEGSYTVKHTETDKVTGEVAESTGEFIIRYPQPSTSIDREVNPDEITGKPKLPEGQSDVTWEIFDKDGNLLYEGKGTIGKDILDLLPNGEYYVVHTETDKVTGEVAKSDGYFIIDRVLTPTPETPITTNPEEVNTGDKTNIMLFFGVSIVSLSIMIILVLKKRKQIA